MKFITTQNFLFGLLFFIGFNNMLSQQKQLILTIYQYNTNTSEINMTQKIKDKEDDEIGSGKIAYINTNEDIERVKKYSKYYNKLWFFLIDNESMIKEMESYNDTEVKPNGIISRSDFDFSKIKNYPVYISNSSDWTNQTEFMEFLKKYDYFEGQTNTFARFSYLRQEIIYPIVYLMINSITVLSLSVLVAVLWNIKKKFVNPGSIFLLQSLYIYIIYFNILLAITIVVEVFLVLRNSKESSQKEVYIETALVTFNAIFRTLLWFIIIIVIAGWQILTQKLEREDIKKI